MSVPDVLGAAATVASLLLWFPQALVTWRNRHNAAALAGISAATHGLVILNATLWAVYAVVTGTLWAGAPGLVNLPLAVATIWFVARARRRMMPGRPAAACPCGFPDAATSHELVWTAGPGGGSVVACTGAPHPLQVLHTAPAASPAAGVAGVPA